MTRRWAGGAWPVAALGLLSVCWANPISTHPNANETGSISKTDTCQVGESVRVSGEQWSVSACERCSCEGGSVRCERERCTPRPGCKALHRPDHCCPTYQCECLVDERVYGNGEKLPSGVGGVGGAGAEPCRVCYCQGGEVVCRRVACFLRDDCRPRLVPGRCCPEYDNCPLTGSITVSSDNSSMLVNEMISSETTKQSIKPEITIKEITPVSEIPIISGVKIKEMPPTFDVNDAEFASSKSPLTPREVTTEKSSEPDNKALFSKSDSTSKLPNLLSTTAYSSTSDSSNFLNDRHSYDERYQQSYSASSVSAQDAIDVNTLDSKKTSSVSAQSSTTSPGFRTTRSPYDDDDSLLFEHNPAFPPLPDDLSVPGNHEEEITESNMDIGHISRSQNTLTSNSLSNKEQTTTKNFVDTAIPIWRESQNNENSSIMPEKNIEMGTVVKSSVLLDLKSAIPSEILNIPSTITENIAEEQDDFSDITNMTDKVATTVNPLKDLNIVITESQQSLRSSQSPIENTPSTISLSSSSITSQIDTVFLPNSTSQKNIEYKNNLEKPTSVRNVVSETSLSPVTENAATNANEITTSVKTDDEIQTTELIISPSESSTDEVFEIIKVSTDSSKKSNLISTEHQNKNAIHEFINLVGDIASISDHKDFGTTVDQPSSKAPEIKSPVNIGFKSKTSNTNVNSITKLLPKNKNQISSLNKQKLVEIEEEEASATLHDHDKIEPTTQRPIIDKVSANDQSKMKTEKKDIEIITHSYVPTINIKPFKLVEKDISEPELITANTPQQLPTARTTLKSDLLTEQSTLGKDQNTNELSSTIASVQ